MKKAVDTFSSDSFLSLSSRLEPGPGFEDPWNRSTIRSSRAAATRLITGRFRSSTMSTASFGKRYCKTGACGAARCPRVRLPALTPPSAGARRIGPAAFTLTCRGSQPPYRAAADTGYRPSQTRVVQTSEKCDRVNRMDQGPAPQTKSQAWLDRRNDLWRKCWQRDRKSHPTPQQVQHDGAP